MTAIYLLALNFILSLTLSQFVPISLTSWTDLTPGGSKNCETIGGYNYATGKIHIYGGEDVYGGSDQAKYIFDATEQDYDLSDQTYLSAGNEIELDGDYTQRHGPNADNILYFVSGTDIKGINMNGDDTIVETYSTKATQDKPALCMDDTNNILYSVGNNEIFTCADLQSTTPGTCTSLQYGELEKISEAACAFHEGFIYIFGGYHEETGEQNTVWKCNATAATSCDPLPNLVTARRGINALVIQCFTNNYVALIGGQLAIDASGIVEIYNLKTDTQLSIQGAWQLAEERRQFVSVFDPISESIFLFGGRGDGSTVTDCRSDVIFTNSASDGLCYTEIPTMDPTMEPTVYPTYIPTVNPTKIPTNVPTTKIPTNVPTKNPTTKPVVKPTAEPYKPQTGGFTTTPSSYGIIIAILILLCCIILCCVFWYSREEKDHVYGAMPQDVGGAAVPMAVIVTYCDSCGKATPCSCGSCGKCGKSTCKNECGQKCNNCGTTDCDGRTCRKTTPQ